MCLSLTIIPVAGAVKEAVILLAVLLTQIPHKAREYHHLCRLSTLVGPDIQELGFQEAS